MTYPNLTEVEEADRIQLARWYRFLPSPKSDEQVEVIRQIHDRFKAMGGFTPAISKAIGWEA